jgi:hypothetical protein
MLLWFGLIPQHLCLRTKADFFCVELSFIFYWLGMVRRILTIPERWQAVGMHNGGLDEYILIFPGEKLVYTQFSEGNNE